eukprot:2031564-Rhodomonas_salina.1
MCCYVLSSYFLEPSRVKLTIVWEELLLLTCGMSWHDLMTSHQLCRCSSQNPPWESSATCAWSACIPRSMTTGTNLDKFGQLRLGPRDTGRLGQKLTYHQTLLTPAKMTAAPTIELESSGTTRDRGLTFCGDSDGKSVLIGYLDADWSNDPHTSKSVSGEGEYWDTGPSVSLFKFKLGQVST